MSEFDQALRAVYFSLTTLTTTGLGDFFPVTDTERMV